MTKSLTSSECLRTERISQNHAVSTILQRAALDTMKNVPPNRSLPRTVQERALTQGTLGLKEAPPDAGRTQTPQEKRLRGIALRRGLWTN